MAAGEYFFVDRWFIPHPREAVWPRVVNAPDYPNWWGEVYDRVTPLNDLPPDRVGARSDVLAHGRLPYRIRFIAEVTEVVPPRKLALRADGDLTGTGVWRLEECGGATAVSFEWRVRADKPLIRIFSPVVKPLFAWNHRWTMKRGEAALLRSLEADARARRA